MKSEITDPLGMKSTSGYVTNDIVDSYQYFLYSSVLPKKIEYHQDNIPEGFVSSTASDMAIYLRELIKAYNSNPNAIIDKKVTDLLFNPNTNNIANYGLGWFIFKRNDLLVVGHDGLNPSFVTDMIIVPELSIGIVLLINSNDVSVWSISNGIFDILVDKQPVAPSRTLFYILRSFPILALIFIVILFFAIRKWKRLHYPIFMDKRILPNFILTIGIAFGLFWVLFFPFLMKPP